MNSARDTSRVPSWCAAMLIPVCTTIALFLLRLPWIDLPVWDDGNIYGNGELLLRGNFNVLSIQWHPPLIALAALLSLIFPTAPIPGFFLFMLFAHLTVAVGAYLILRTLNWSEKEAGWIAALWVALIHILCVMADFPTLHLYHAGVPLMIAAYLVRQRPVSIPLGLGLIALAFLFRNESILVMVMMALAGWWRRRSAGGPVWTSNRWGTVAVWVTVVILLGLLVQRPGTIGSGRLTYAFTQSFYRYALATLQYDAVIPPTRDREVHTMNQAFGDGASQASVPDLFMRNPVAFVRFMATNLEMLVRGDWFGNHHYLLGWLISGVVIVSIAGVLYVVVRNRNLVLFFILAALLIKWPLYMITTPRFYYAADVMLLLLFGMWKFITPRWGARIVHRLGIVFLVVGVVSLTYGPHWERDGLLNLKRAQFVRETIEGLGLSGVVLVERYGPFSRTFTTPVVRWSDTMRAEVYRMGNGIYSPSHQLYDFVLIEEGTPIRQDIQEWANRQTPVARQDPFSLYWQQDISMNTTAPGPGDLSLWVTDSFYAEENLVGHTDHDSFHNRQLAIKWNPRMESVDTSGAQTVRVWVSDSPAQPFRVLGTLPSLDLTFFEWKRGNPFLDSAIAQGPVYGSDYRFRVEFLAGSEVVSTLATAEPVRFLSFVTVHDDETATEDISGGVDQDREAERALTIRWNLDPEEVDPAFHQEVHVYFRTVPDGALTYFARQSDLQQNQLTWRAGEENILPQFRGGPEFDTTYEFLIYIIQPGGGSIYSPFHAAAPVRLERAP